MVFGFRRDSDNGRKRSRDSSQSRKKKKQEPKPQLTQTNKILKISDQLEASVPTSNAGSISSSSSSSSSSRSKVRGSKIPLGPKMPRSERRGHIATQRGNLPVHGTQMTITFDQATMSWVFPAGFNATFAAPAPPSDVPRLSVPQVSAPSGTRPPGKYSGNWFEFGIILWFLGSSYLPIGNWFEFGIISGHELLFRLFW